MTGACTPSIAVKCIEWNLNGARVHGQFNLAYTNAAGKQLPSTTDVLTYPCQGVTGTGILLSHESPSVITNRDYDANPTGQPIFITVRPGQQLTITSASLTETIGGAAVPLQPTLTNANDRNFVFDRNEAMLIPDVALKANTNYTVDIVGVNSGQAFTKHFTFTTGTYSTR